MNKHDSLCDLLFSYLSVDMQSGFYTNIKRNEEYYNNTRTLGECDCHAINTKFEIYFEVKSKDSKNSRNKAMKHLIRWCDYQIVNNPNKNYYGIYYTPEHTELMVINGQNNLPYMSKY